ncbi:hypothetical protein ACKWTF_006485 [Chironomus riparius]
MDRERDKKILNKCENLATYYINSIIEQVAPEINQDFPEYPEDVPQELLFVPPKQLNLARSIEKTKKPRIKKEKVLSPKIEFQDVNECKRSTSKRKCHYSGTYNIEKQLEILLDDESESDNNVLENVKHPISVSNDQCSKKDAEDVKNISVNISGIQKLSPEQAVVEINNYSDEFSQKLETFQKFIIKKQEKPRIQTLSDTSSDEEETQEELGLSLKFPMCLIERCDSQVNLSKKSLDSPEKPQTSNGIIKNHQAPIPVFKKQENEKDCQGLKSLFEGSSFDEAMQKYAEKKSELLKFVPPKIIPAPEQDPAIKKPIKKKPIKANGMKNDENNPNKHLGGIFTINNGWDKKEIEAQDEQKKENLSNKLERHITPPNIVIDTNIEDVMAAHDEFMYNENFMDNLLVPQDSKTSLSTTSSHSLQIALRCDKLTENNSFKGRKINSSLNSTDEDSDNEEIIKPSKKIQRFLYSDDENTSDMETQPKNINSKGHNDNDVVSLFAEAGEFDDLVDEKDQFYAEVDPDDLKIKVQCVKRRIEPLDHQTEFEINTNEISQHMVDPETDKILKTTFGNVCPAFLESRCSMPACHRNHFLPDESEVYPLLIDARFDVLHKVFQVVLRFHRLFQTYISTLVQICIKNKDDMGLVELVKACDRLPRTIVCYKDIVRNLVELDYMKNHKAISFIITHHTDSEIARDTILSLILDSGPNITFFMDYVEEAHMKQPIRSDMFSRILHTCVSYQNPKLPNFCLNYLQACTANQMKNLNSEHLKAFLRMNKCISELNEHREAKALRITQKLLSEMNW